MKNRYKFLILLLFAGAIVSCKKEANEPKTIINLQEGALKEYVIESFDTDKDGEISEEEALKVTRIGFGQGNISSLEGIENFPNLTYFSCSSNKLTTLDLSKNTALEVLRCYSNKLTTLDLSKNTELTMLWCDNNNLTNLDLSENTALRVLWCARTTLTTLDLSKNTELYDLNCATNSLTTLDLSSNIELANLDFSRNLLTTLDVSKNMALTLLRCTDNLLTTLNLSKNTKLEGLTCIMNPNLETVIIKNHLQDISISKDSHTSIEYVK